MPVPNSIDDLEPVPADNYPAGSEPVFPNLDNYLRAHAAFIAQLRELLGTAGSDIESIEEEIGSVNAALALRVAKTSDTGIALLPEGSDAQRPVTGSIPAGALVMRGNIQDPAEYKPEFWDRFASGWKVFASQPWVQAITNALNGRVARLEGLGQCQAWVNFNGAGAVAIRASNNVISVTDNGVGDYTVNFATSMPIAEYAAVPVAKRANSTSISSTIAHPFSQTTNNVRLQTVEAGVGLSDSENISLAIFC